MLLVLLYQFPIAGVGDIAGWTLPLSLLAENEILSVTTCNVDVKTASSFFKSMCAPGSLNSYNNPFGKVLCLYIYYITFIFVLLLVFDLQFLILVFGLDIFEFFSGFSLFFSFTFSLTCIFFCF